MMTNSNCRILLPLLIAISLFHRAVASEYEPIDTTKVREVTSVKKSLGEKIADIPGEILKLPFYTGQFIAKTVSTAPVVQRVFSLLRFGGEKRWLSPVGGYSSRTGLKAGFALQKPDFILAGGRLQYKWYYSTHDYQLYQFKYESDYSVHRGFGIQLYTRYKKRTREGFFGIGNRSLEEKEANITLERTELAGSASYRLARRMLLSVNTSYQSANLFDGKDPDHIRSIGTIVADSSYSLKTGQLASSRYFTIGTSLEYDSRNNPGQPSRGIQFFSYLDRFVGTGRSNGNDFTQYGIDVRAYHDIWRKRIVALRIRLQRVDMKDVTGRNIPLYRMSTLGGRDGLRGYSRSRFIDNDLIVVSLEYRYPVFNLLDAFLFVDAGRVYSDLTDVEVLENWKQSVGVGLRIWQSSGTTGLAQLARSNEDVRFYFEFGATW